MPDQRPDRTTRAIVDGVRNAGRRLVLSSGWAELGRDVPDDVFVAGSVAHPALFPRCAAIVHHGGAGTTSAAARAGVPQVVVPHAFDQFEFARRVVDAGLGPAPIPRPKLGGRSLASALDVTLGTPQYARRAAEVGAAIRARDGVSRAVEILTSPAAMTQR